jgi:hypothetical protein
VGQIQTGSARSRLASHTDPNPPLEHLDSLTQVLITNSVAVSTQKTYATSIRKLSNFRFIYHLPDTWPVPVKDVLLFIAYCSHHGLSASSLNTYIAGISHTHKTLGLIDPTKSFLVVKALEGLRRIQGGQVNDPRAPISIQLLGEIIACLKYICTNAYEQVLFTAAFSLAFFGLLRVSEFTTPTNKASSHRQLLVSDISVSTNMVLLRIRWSKTDQLGLSVTLQIEAQPGIFCPVNNLTKYLKDRPNSGSSNLFIHFNAKPLTKYQFCSVLQKALHFINAPGHFRSHSFRIGGATYLYNKGVPEERIKVMGRWKSQTYTRYIRLTH